MFMKYVICYYLILHPSPTCARAGGLCEKFVWIGKEGVKGGEEYSNSRSRTSRHSRFPSSQFPRKVRAESSWKNGPLFEWYDDLSKSKLLMLQFPTPAAENFNLTIQSKISRDSATQCRIF
jgi:hypothetical protein